MKLFMIMYAGPSPQRVTAVLDAQEARGFTEIAGAHGKGDSGRHEGSRAWPGETSVLFTILPDERVPALAGALRALGASAGPGERLHVAVVPVEQFF